MKHGKGGGKSFFTLSSLYCISHGEQHLGNRLVLHIAKGIGAWKGARPNGGKRGGIHPHSICISAHDFTSHTPNRLAFCVKSPFLFILQLAFFSPWARTREKTGKWMVSPPGGGGVGAFIMFNPQPTPEDPVSIACWALLGGRDMQSLLIAYLS